MEEVKEAQEAVTCGSCSSLVQHFCLTCSVRLCDNCKSFHEKLHRIVLYIEKYSGELELCATHKQVFQIFCKTCDDLACIKCLITKHRGHDLTEIKEKYEEEKRKYKQETEDIKFSALRATRLSLEKNEQNISDLSKKFSEIRKATTDDAHLAMETIEHGLQRNLSVIDHLESDSSSFLSDQRKALQKHLELIENHVKSREEKPIEGNPISFLMEIKMKGKMKTEIDFTKIPEGVFYPPPSFERKPHDKSLKEDLMGVCGHISYARVEKDEREMLRFVPSPPAKYWRDDIVEVKTLSMIDILQDNVLRCVRHTKNGNVWITDTRHIYQIKDDGTLVNKITISLDESFVIDSLGSDRNGNLIICVCEDENCSDAPLLKIVETNISWPLEKNEGPCGICLVDNKIVALVSTGIRETLKLKFCYEDGTSEKDKVVLDKKLQSAVLVRSSLFKGGIFPENMSFNPSNRQLVISNAMGVVVGSTLDGKYQFQYNGKQPGLACEFRPWSVECDHYGHVLVADHLNNCIHLLNKDGEFLSLIATEKQGIHHPYGLGIDENGLLWVTNFNEKTIKIIKYLEDDVSLQK